MEAQTRSEENGLRTFNTLKEAFAHAEDTDITVWKISFTVGGDGDHIAPERVRLVRDPEDGRWMYDSI